MTPTQIIRGFEIYDGFLNIEAQYALVETVREIAKAAPLFRPVLPSGAKMSVRMTSAGALGWVVDEQGYRYQSYHPLGMAWPALPEALVALWSTILPQAASPDTCLVNFYGADARMGMHQDRDEGNLSHPVLSVSLGDSARFRMGNIERSGTTDAIWLRSGDVVVMAGGARMKYHGVDKIETGSSMLLPKGGRLNLTMRRAQPD